ncbi:MAG: GNAT family N-acetyltransferase [archaeon]
MKIRKANEQDYDRIAELYKQGFSEGPYNEPWTLDKALDKLKLFLKYCDIYVAVDDDKIIGFVIANPNHWCPGEVIFGEEIVVDNKYRRKGVAKKLTNYIEEKYKEKGFKLVMTIINKKANSYQLTKSLGFIESKSNIIMEKKL